GRVMRPLAQRTRVCAYDRAGAGQSDAGPLPRSPRAIGADLWAGLDAQGVTGKVILVGHSAGGVQVRHAAAQRPERVAGLVLVDPTVPAMGEAMLAPFIARARTCLAALAAPGDPPQGCRVRPPADPLAAWTQRLSELEELFAEPVPDVAVPTLVLTAGKPASPAREALHAAIPGAQQKVVAESGHMMMFDAPEAIVAAVEALLDPAP
ncbi:MAG: alpha/beta fold hydrolase, partial [Sphingomonadaceae bacterium]